MDLLHQIFSKFNQILTVEDGVLQGGFGSAVLEFMIDHHYCARIVRLGVPDKFIEHGSQDELIRECGFDAQGIQKTAEELLAISSKRFTILY